MWWLLCRKFKNRQICDIYGRQSCGPLCRGLGGRRTEDPLRGWECPWEKASSWILKVDRVHNLYYVNVTPR